MIYYDQDGIVVRDTIEADTRYVAKHMRQSDKDEIWASHNHTPDTAMQESLKSSVLSMTVLNGYPIAVFGVVPWTLTGQRGTVWLLATDGMDKIKRRFAKNSRHFIDIMLSQYPYLENFVDCRNEKSIKWLRLCGAEMSEPINYGVEGLPFKHFSFKRK